MIQSADMCVADAKNVVSELITFYAFCTHEKLQGVGDLHFTPTDSIYVTKGNKILN